MRAKPVGNVPAWRAQSRAVLGAALLAAGTSLLAGCPAVVEPQPPQQAIIKAPEKAPNRDLRQVQTGNLALPYDRLGELTYIEPFSPKAIDDDYIDDQLRTMAMRKWGDQVDAVIGVKIARSADGRRVSVTAQAVKVRGDCSFCRHQVGAATGK